MNFAILRPELFHRMTWKSFIIFTECAIEFSSLHLRDQVDLRFCHFLIPSLLVGLQSFSLDFAPLYPTFNFLLEIASIDVSLDSLLVVRSKGLDFDCIFDLFVSFVLVQKNRIGKKDFQPTLYTSCLQSLFFLIHRCYIPLIDFLFQQLPDCSQWFVRLLSSCCFSCPIWDSHTLVPLLQSNGILGIISNTLDQIVSRIVSIARNRLPTGDGLSAYFDAILDSLRFVFLLSTLKQIDAC